MRYEILGPLRVVDGSRKFSLSAPKMEMVLATLLVGAGHFINKEQLIGELWAGVPPRRAAAAVHVYISQLRKFLVSAGDIEGHAIATRPAGYLLNVKSGGLDLKDFQEAVRRGHAHRQAGEYEGTLEEFERALALVRGQVLDGLAEGPLLSTFAAWVEEERLQCLEESVEARAALGRHREVVGLLYGLIADHPLRESFYRQLMLVLYRSERQVEALQVFRTAQRVLRSELGLEPCRSLRRLHQAILTSDRELDLSMAS